MGEIARVIPVVPVSLVATVFVRAPERAWSELELKGEVLRLIRELEGRGAHVYVPRGDQDYAITVGLRMLTLRRLVDEADGLFRARPEELPLLELLRELDRAPLLTVARARSPRIAAEAALTAAPVRSTGGR